MGELAEKYNAHASNVGEMLSASKQSGLKIAVESAKVAKRVKDSYDSAKKQRELTEIIFSSSTGVNQAINEISQNAA
ncbi:MAG: hypothetical protein QMD32_03855, partial [Smithellaceae bacterium]|nr:hypothetical protein [Smithellaceae bacterium]